MKCKKSISVFIILFLVGSFVSFLKSEELPKPEYGNSFIFSLTYQTPTPPAAEVDYIKSQFGGGLYSWLAFSSFQEVSLDWSVNPGDAGSGIREFEDTIDILIQKAKAYGVGIHVTLIYGLARSPNLYKSSKVEDIRNAQWYNDNNIASGSQLDGTAQISSGDVDDFFRMNRVEETSAVTINKYMWGTFSRYARKLRNHLEAKVRAVFDYLKKKQDENPDIFIIVSAPGEAELNNNRINPTPVLQEYFCDYSPFAVLEFRDWIKHDGMYGEGGKYEGEGYENGGIRYRGDSGLQNLNTDFGTGFTTWSLKYYNWALSDPVDTDYTDSNNPDPKIIPFFKYIYDGMKPQTGSNFTNGGFDPPREMKKKGEEPFSDLWQYFRETLVHHYVKDMAAVARDSGFSGDHYFSHQIPADYLFGTRPNDPDIILNERYYSSASPLWTAATYPEIGIGVTMYDINFIQWIVRTSRFSVPALSSMTDNWAALEYNPEIVLTDNPKDISSVEIIYPEIMRLYDYNAHMINFFYWDGSLVYRYKGTNREIAAKRFFDSIKDKARGPVTIVFTPPPVKDFSGGYVSEPETTVELIWSPLIWSDLKYKWKDWGDFKEFVIYRGITANFEMNSASEIARVKNFSYSDTGFTERGMIYYKIVAENGEEGRGIPMSFNVFVAPKGVPVLELSRDSFNFGAVDPSEVTPSQAFVIKNIGEGEMEWTVSKDADWIICSPGSGKEYGTVNVAVNAQGKAAGTYTGAITVNAGNAIYSPKTVHVNLTVYESVDDAPPVGSFETPSNGVTVRGSIAVSGWALDDIAVESVKIYIKQESAQTYIGDAVFIEGVRPDIEVAYKTYPANYKSGWGYMLLTHLLPDGGNGTYELIAVARDNTGQETVLGANTIICDNALSVKPFGAIDSPEQGGMASGEKYLHKGWVLTPMPNSIPTDGTTIDIYIDGVKIGRPVYNNYREDIALLFPGYANSKGAAGYFYIDTTQYENGLHTISWKVKDSAGNEDGIGSRYFFIENTTAR